MTYRIKFVNALKGKPWREYDTDTSRLVIYTSADDKRITGLAVSPDIFSIIMQHKEVSVIDWGNYIAEEIHAKYPQIDIIYARVAVKALRTGVGKDNHLANLWIMLEE